REVGPLGNGEGARKTRQPRRRQVVIGDWRESVRAEKDRRNFFRSNDQRRAPNACVQYTPNPLNPGTTLRI
ncbi:MAG: hypothetical protein Q7R45_00550, partial [Sulfuricaulis sp.]|nr:hypothetical protein [Sulfuricaulis sp.]